jgi:hypothetical protein
VIVPTPPVPGELARHLTVITTPPLWAAWPFLPLVRRTAGGVELGVLFDARGAADLTGYSATVFFTLCGAPHNVNYADSAVMRSCWT